MANDSINYPKLIDQAMRVLVRDVLKTVQNTGLPNGHHFYISYSTMHPSVKMSDQLRAKYPKEITIVIQHQFWDFKVEDSQFHVTLSFSGAPEKLVVPYAALTAFADPSVKFGLQFQPAEVFDVKPQDFEEMKQENSDIQASPVNNEDATDKIISLDAFRKK